MNGTDDGPPMRKQFNFWDFRGSGVVLKRSASRNLPDVEIVARGEGEPPLTIRFVLDSSGFSADHHS